MEFYLKLPFVFLRFWFIEAPVGMAQYFSSLNKAFLQLFSLPLFIKTFFKPLKNEYRQGLVGFSIAMGIAVKTVFIAIDLILFSLLVAIEILLVLALIGMLLLAILLLIT